MLLRLREDVRVAERLRFLFRPNMTMLQKWFDAKQKRSRNIERGTLPIVLTQANDREIQKAHEKWGTAKETENEEPTASKHPIQIECEGFQ